MPELNPRSSRLATYHGRELALDPTGEWWLVLREGRQQQRSAVLCGALTVTMMSVKIETSLHTTQYNTILDMYSHTKCKACVCLCYLLQCRSHAQVVRVTSIHTGHKGIDNALKGLCTCDYNMKRESKCA